MDILTRLVMTSALGGSWRGGLWKGLVDWILGSVMLFVMILVRGDMARQVRRLGRLAWGFRHEEALSRLRPEKAILNSNPFASGVYNDQHAVSHSIFSDCMNT